MIVAAGCAEKEEAPKPTVKKAEEVKPGGTAKPVEAPSAEKK
jgi:hypothetical protein